MLTAIRVDDKPIRRRTNVTHPDVIVCFDPSLLGPALLEGADEHTVVLVNSTKPPEAWRGTPAEALIDYGNPAEEQVLFDGTAREAAARFAALGVVGDDDRVVIQ